MQDTINNLEDSLRELNTSIQNDGADRVLNVTIDFANSIIDDVLGYANYAAGQVRWFTSIYFVALDQCIG